MNFLDKFFVEFKKIVLKMALITSVLKSFQKDKVTSHTLLVYRIITQTLELLIKFFGILTSTEVL